VFDAQWRSWGHFLGSASTSGKLGMLGMTLTFKIKKNLLFFFIAINTREKIVEITVLSFNLEKLTNKYFGSLKNMFYRFLKKKIFFQKNKKKVLN
jgi:hypothetical protein